MFFISIIMGETALGAQGIIFDRKELSTYANIVSGKINKKAKLNFLS